MTNGFRLINKITIVRTAYFQLLLYRIFIIDEQLVTNGTEKKQEKE